MSDPAQPGDDRSEIRLTLPALPLYARVARLAMTGLATRNGFTYDAVEDLRIAVGEVFGMLVDGDATEPTEERVRLTCRIDDDALEIQAERVPTRSLAEVGELSRIILGAIVEEATIDAPAGRITITKRVDAP